MRLKYRVCRADNSPAMRDFNSALKRTETDYVVPNLHKLEQVEILLRGDGSRPVVPLPDDTLRLRCSEQGFARKTLLDSLPEKNLGAADTPLLWTTTKPGEPRFPVFRIRLKGLIPPGKESELPRRAGAQEQPADQANVENC